MVNIKAVIFDFGGTLFTYEGFVAGRPAVAAKLAELLGTEAVADVEEAFAAGRAQAAVEYMARPYYLHRDWGIAGARYAAEAIGKTLRDNDALEFHRFRTESMREYITPRPGMGETLAELRSRGLHVGGASNSDIDQFEMMVESLDVREAFDSLMCSEHVRSCKPDGKFFEAALAQAGCGADEAVYVGDTPMADIDGGNRAGMRTVLIEETSADRIDRGTPGDEDVLIRELPELLDYLDTL
jgi:HAD superfamily hydrolase (TIGR01509 family)